MNRKVFLIVLFTVLSVVSAINATAQVEKKTRQSRREQRQNQLNLEKELLLNSLKDNTVQFVASELVSSGRAALSNIKLKQFYYVDISPQNFKCFLPIYGASSAVGQPTLMRQLDIFASEYEIELKESKNSVYIDIYVRDNRSNRNYKFSFTVTPTGKQSTLFLSADFSTPATFRGDFFF